MTPLQVQFCYYVARGNANKAQVMLPSMQGDNSLFDGAQTPAIFCLWAAKQPDRHGVLSKLVELYPHIAPPKDALPASPTSIEETVCKVLVPAIKPHLRRLLSAILNATPEEIRADHKTKAGFEILSCAAALQFILSHQAFKNNTVEWKDLTARILNKLLDFQRTQLEANSEDTPTHCMAPASVKAVLNENNQNGFQKHFPSVKQKPKPAPDDNKENDSMTDTARHKLGAAPSQGFFTSRQLHGRQALSSTAITPDLHGSTPPPAPKCVNQVLASYDLVARRPTPFRKRSTEH